MAFDLVADRAATVHLSPPQVLYILGVICNLLHDIPDQLQDTLGALHELSLDVHVDGGLARRVEGEHPAAVQVEDQDRRHVGEGPPDAGPHDLVVDHRAGGLVPDKEVEDHGACRTGWV